MSLKSTVSFSISSRISSAILESLTSVYLMAAGESPSMEPKLPCPSMRGYRSENSCTILVIAS